MRPGISSRMAAYKRPEVRRILSSIIRGERPDQGDSEGALDLLLGLGIIREAGRESWMRDPATGSTSFRLRPLCPYCGSSDVSKEELLEHVGCGYVGRASDFLRGGECAVCPRCGRPAELRRIGSWFYCRSCGRSFQHPRLMADFGGRVVPVEDLEPVVVTRYELNPELEDEVRGVLAIYSALEGRLRSLGYSLDGSTSVVGASGVVHRFDLAARSPSGVLYADVLLAEDETMLLAGLVGSLAKYVDVGGGSRILLLLAPSGDIPHGFMSGCCPGRLHLVEGADFEELASLAGELRI